MKENFIIRKNKELTSVIILLAQNATNKGFVSAFQFLLNSSMECN